VKLPRYPEYKDSGVPWLGEVPSHWDCRRLKHIAHVMPSNVDKKLVNGEETVRLCNYTDVYYNEELTDSLPYMVATAAPSQVERFALLTGDVVITKDSESADDIAVAALVVHDLAGVVCGYHLALVRPRQNACGAFLKRLFDSRYVKGYVATRANGLTRVGLSQYVLDNLPLAVPPFEEQRAIALFLERETAKIDALIAEQERLIALLDEKRKAVITQAVTKGLDPSAPMKDSGVEWIGETPVHWLVRRIASLFREVADAGSDELPILTVSIHSGVSDRELPEHEMERKVSRSDDRSKYKAVQPDDLVYNTMRAWQGAFGAVRARGMVSPAYVVARPRVQVATEFVEQLLRTPPAIEQMRRNSRGVTDFRLRLYWDEFKDLTIPLPPHAEVVEICRRISQMTHAFDELVSECGWLTALLRERRTALITAVVTGQIDVRGLVDVEAA
jgi:type I restriction enzyme S subunit